MTQKLYDQLINSPRGMSTAAMRDVLLPLILGQETDGILYWIGKDLARQFPVATPGDLSLLTHQLGLGDLRLTSSHNTTMTWELSGPVIAERLALQKEATSFTLEAGFLAKQVEFQTSKVTEATVLEKKKDTVVILTSDHGGLGKKHGSTTLAEMEIPFILAGPVVKPVGEFDLAMMQYDCAAVIADLLGVEPPIAWRGRAYPQLLTK